MAFPVHTPRVNNNDDQVRLIRVVVERGQAVRAGDLVAEVETDKALFEVESERDGYVLSIVATDGEVIDVGSVLLWLGGSPDEPPPGEADAPAAAAAEHGTDATAKARVLIHEHGLEAAAIRPRGSRITVEDVELHLAARRGAVSASEEDRPPGQLPAGEMRPLSPEERAMLRSVLWHRDEAAPVYLEIAYDPAAWIAFAAAFAKRHGLLLSPLLGLMAHQLGKIAAATSNLNATIVDGQRLQYSQVNVGFTVQVLDTLYLPAVAGAESLDALEFVRRLAVLQKKAMAHRLTAAEMGPPTVGFTSMERWRVTRHIPVLPPRVSVMVAQTMDAEGKGILGATYDHRVLTGGEVALALKKLTAPMAQAEE